MADSNDIRTDVPPTGQATTLAVRENFAAVKAAVKNGEDQIVRVDSAAAAETTRVNTALDGKAQRAGDLGGTTTSTLVTQLQGRPLANTAPAAGQTLTWQSGQWMPVTAGAGLVDAPQDGFVYGRINGQWVRIFAPGNVWTLQASADDTKDWMGVASSGSLFVAVAQEAIMTSTNGISWTSRTAPSPTGVARQWRRVAFGQNKWIAISNTPGSSMTSYTHMMGSPDAVTWTMLTPVWSHAGHNIAYANNLWVRVNNAGPGGTAAIVQTSADGITFTARTVPGSNPTFGVVWGNDLWVVVGTAAVYSSPDGVTWTDRTSGVPGGSAAVGNLEAVAYGAGRFVAVGGAGMRIMYSPDGSTWTKATVPQDHVWHSVAFGFSTFVAVGEAGAIAVSPDGSTWTMIPAPAANNWQSVCAGPNSFVAVSNDGVHRVMTSP